MRGSKPGERRGGRRKGVPNKASAAKAEAIAASGLTPLDYMLSVMRDEANPSDMRLDAAHKAARFVHPALAAIEHSGGVAISHEAALDELDDEPGKGDTSSSA